MTAPQPISDTTKRIASDLRSARGRANVSVAEVIRLTGTSKDRTYGIFNGLVSPTIDELVAICGVFHLELAELVRGPQG